MLLLHLIEQFILKYGRRRLRTYHRDVSGLIMIKYFSYIDVLRICVHLLLLLLLRAHHYLIITPLRLINERGCGVRASVWVILLERLTKWRAEITCLPSLW